MTEIKPGKWRLADGEEVVVFYSSHDISWFSAGSNSNVVREHWSAFSSRRAEYLGPAVIGDDSIARSLAMLQVDLRQSRLWANELEEQRGNLDDRCRELEAETVATRVLLEQSEDRCEELARQLEQPAKSQWAYVPVIPRAQQAEAKLASAQCVIEGLEERVRFLEEQAAGMPEVADENGVKVHRFKSVTVMVRGEREAIVRWWVNAETWQGWDVMTGYSCSYPDREDSEAWCREQLEPKRRKAGMEDVGSACLVRTRYEKDWSEATLICCDFLYESPYCAAIDGRLDTWDECEIQD